jgi:hypothetical protein
MAILIQTTQIKAKIRTSAGYTHRVRHKEMGLRASSKLGLDAFGHRGLGIEQRSRFVGYPWPNLVVECEKNNLGLREQP